jgi:hypothetical protein
MCSATAYYKNKKEAPALPPVSRVHCVETKRETNKRREVFIHGSAHGLLLSAPGK